MADFSDIDAIARDLPDSEDGVEGHRGGRAWRASKGMYVWERPASQTDHAQLAELGRTWPDGTVVGVRVDGMEGKAQVLAAYDDVAFDTPHFAGYPAVLVRLDDIDVDRLRELVVDSWMLRTTAARRKEWAAASGR
ncbi:hypothetical protein ABC304_04630 [Microbacterium sp. 1P10UB]|uniref:hypothetical protein n=1 Tax=unclassified Microbacterium TaxID=2609290 RepID=UPI0039A1FEBE